MLVRLPHPNSPGAKLSSDPVDRWATANPGRVALLVWLGYPVGALVLGLAVYNIGNAPIGLDEEHVVMSERAEFRNLGGAVHFINVGGREFECGGEEHKYPRRWRDWVVFDPSDPSRCRLKRNARLPNTFELTHLLSGAVLLTLSFTLHNWSYRYSRKTIEQRYRASRWLLAAVVVLQTVAGVLWVIRWP